MISFTRLVAAPVSVIALLAFTVSARWSYADWLSTQPSLGDRRRAVKLAPADATVWLRLADLTSVAGEDSRPVLKKALLCSPSDAAIWVRLGIEFEAYREFGEAERYLVGATRLDHDLIPIWTLTNFYFRRGDPVRFFPAARGVLAFSRDDLTPVFRMAWALTPDANRMLTEGMPDAPRPLTAYLKWLVSADFLDAAEPVAVYLLGRFPGEGKEALLSYCERLIATGRWQHAAELWNDMDARKLINTGPVGGHAILNASFRQGSLNRGFDWRLTPVDGIEVNSESPGLWIRFGERQPDRAEIASQTLLLDKGISYRLRSRFQFSGIDAALGLYWSIPDPRDGRGIRRSTDLSAANGNLEWTFTIDESGSDAGAAPLRLVLFYERPPAGPRGNGWVRIDSLSLERLP